MEPRRLGSSLRMPALAPHQRCRPPRLQEHGLPAADIKKLKEAGAHCNAALGSALLLLLAPSFSGSVYAVVPLYLPCLPPNAGFHTVEALAHAPSKELAAVKGISDAKVQKYKDIGGWLPPCTESAAAADIDLLIYYSALCAPWMRPCLKTTCFLL